MLAEVEKKVIDELNKEVTNPVFIKLNRQNQIIHIGISECDIKQIPQEIENITQLIMMA
ncbi:MAG: hypothetical protein ACTSR8_02480 [Promethearchaeota archaeon]